MGFTTRLITLGLLTAAGTFAHNLDGALRTAAEGFFGTSFEEVEIKVGPEAARFGAVAFTCGDRITIAADVKATPREWMRLLGHELAHVVQQREGRVRATAMVGGHLLNDDAALEREAEDLGERFARGEAGPSRSARRAAVGSALVMQRAIEIGGQPISSQGQLSSRARTVLSFVDGGMQWISWATVNTGVHYNFEDEESMLTQIQSGLHGTPLLLLRGIGMQVHPSKLMTLSPEDLLTTAQWNDAVQATAVQEQQGISILAAAGIRRDQDLAMVSNWLNEMGLSNSALFRALALPDLIALYNLINSSSAPNLGMQEEAAAFAMRHAQSVKTFVDFFHLYVAVNAANGSLPAAGRTARAEDIWQGMMPLLWGYLNGPVVPVGAPVALVLQEIANWVRAGGVLGFPRASLAAAQIAMSGALGDGSAAALAPGVRQYMAAAEAFAEQVGLPTVTLSQDGSETLYTFRSGAGSATVCVDANGHANLVAFGR